MKAGWVKYGSLADHYFAERSLYSICNVERRSAKTEPSEEASPSACPTCKRLRRQMQARTAQGELFRL